jgi:hypothetical protein
MAEASREQAHSTVKQDEQPPSMQPAVQRVSPGRAALVAAVFARPRLSDSKASESPTRLRQHASNCHFILPMQCARIILHF